MKTHLTGDFVLWGKRGRRRRRSTERRSGGLLQAVLLGPGLAVEEGGEGPGWVGGWVGGWVEEEEEEAV